MGFLQHRDQIGVVVMRLDGKEAGALPLAMLDIGFHRAADDRSRAHDGHLHDQILQLFRPGAGEHLDLGAAFDLEDADRVALVDHLVDQRVLEVDAAQIDRRLAFLRDQLQAFLHQ